MPVSRGGRRKPRIPNVYDLHIPLGICSHSAGACALLDALIKHLAYNREQCHTTFPQLSKHAEALKQRQASPHADAPPPPHQQQQLQEHQQQDQRAGRASRRRVKSSTRKALKYYDRLSALLQLAASIPFHLMGGMPVAVLLGASVQRPREVYCLHLPPTMHEPGSVAPPSPAAVSSATRKLVMHLLAEHHTIAEWEEAPGPTKMWLLFQAPEAILDAAPEGFRARRLFGINLKKAFQVNILTGSQPPSGSNGMQQQPRSQQPEPMQLQQQQQQQLNMQDAAAGDVRGLDQLSQQLSRHMHISDTGAVGPNVPVWCQACVHVKGLKAPRQDG